MLVHRVIWQLQYDFEREMGSLGSDDVYTDRLSRGAKIRRIFHERLAYKLFRIGIPFNWSVSSSLRDEVFKIQSDEDELRHEIVNAIENLYGINGVLNTPFKAFEVLV